MSRVLDRLLGVMLALVVPAASSCAAERPVSCSSSMVAQIRQQVTIGMKKADVEKRLAALGVEFDDIPRERFTGRLSGQQDDAAKYASKILAGVKIPKSSFQVVEKTELVTIGFDAGNAVTEVTCQEIFTGP